MAGYPIEQHGPVTVYGSGSPGGKGAGLIRIDECGLPRSARLRTHILATEFFRRFREQGGAFSDDEQALAERILADLGDVPIGVRSSATNEAGAGGGVVQAIHAGEYTSFMLPNNHPDPAVRCHQLQQAVRHIYADFIAKQADEATDEMAILVNPIPGLMDETKAGPVYYPYISGVADSFFPHALKAQDPHEGFARIAFGNGYACVLDDFPVVSMATIRNPIPFEMMRGD